MEHGDKYDISRLTSADRTVLASIAVHFVKADGPLELATATNLLLTTVLELIKVGKLQ